MPTVIELARALCDAVTTALDTREDGVIRPAPEAMLALACERLRDRLADPETESVAALERELAAARDALHDVKNDLSAANAKLLLAERTHG